MHTPQVALILSLFAAARLAAPLPTELDSEPELHVRETLSLGTAGKELAKGLATGGGLAVLVAGAEDLLDPNSASKRELIERDPLSASSLGSALKPVLGSIAGGLTATGLTALLNKEFNSRDLHTRAEVELIERDPLSAAGLGEALKPVIGSIAGGLTATGLTALLSKEFNSRDLHARAGVSGAAATVVENGLADIIGKGAVGGLGSAPGGFGVDGIINKLSNRETEELVAREPLNLGPITKGLIGTAVGLGASTIVEDGLDKLKDAFSRRELNEDLRSRGVAGAVEEGLKDVIGKGIIGGIGSGIGGFGVGEIIDQLTSRDIEELTAREPLTLGPITKGIIGTGVGLGASTIIEDGLDKLKNIFSRQEQSLSDLD